MEKKMNELIKDEKQFEPTDGAKTLSLSQCLTRRILISPDSKKELSATGVNNDLTDGVNIYPSISNSPLLYPSELSKSWLGGALPLDYYNDALKQYVILSQIKQSGEITAPLDSLSALKHYHRFKEFCSGLSGLVLDVGSDRPSHSSLLLPTSCQYLGLDPYAGHGEFRIIALGEILPLKASSVDVVLFNTSLDHILDYHTAIQEAYRILKPGGSIVIATNAWLYSATLLTDTVHFHHFREYEILGSLGSDFEIKDIRRYEDPKHRKHLYGFYVRADKL